MIERATKGMKRTGIVIFIHLQPVTAQCWTEAFQGGGFGQLSDAGKKVWNRVFASFRSLFQCYYPELYAPSHLAMNRGGK